MIKIKMMSMKKYIKQLEKFHTALLKLSIAKDREFNKNAIRITK